MKLKQLPSYIGCPNVETAMAIMATYTSAKEDSEISKDRRVKIDTVIKISGITGRAVLLITNAGGSIHVEDEWHRNHKNYRPVASLRAFLDEFVEEPIMVGDYEVKVDKYAVRVGCQRVPWKTVEKILAMRPKDEITEEDRKLLSKLAPEPHNPRNAPDSVIGLSEGWRLLDKDEIKNRAKHHASIQSWSGHRWEGECFGNEPFSTYRTKLTREELAQLK